VVAGHGQSGLRLDHGHDHPENLDARGTAIHEVPDEHCEPALGVFSTPALDAPAELSQEHRKFVNATMHVADDVEGAAQLRAITAHRSRAYWPRLWRSTRSPEVESDWRDISSSGVEASSPPPPPSMA